MSSGVKDASGLLFHFRHPKTGHRWANPFTSAIRIFVCNSGRRMKARASRFYFAIPTTPHATRAPAAPVGCVLRSSSFSWTTTPRPMIEFFPLNEIIVSI